MEKGVEMAFRQLKLIRKQNKLTQQQLADVLHISRSAYCSYETGRRTPDVETLVKLSEFYNIPVGTIVGSSEPLSLFDSQDYENDEDPRYLSQLTKEEAHLIVSFRTASAEAKSEISAFIKEKSGK